MAGNNVKVSLNALSELKSSLSQLSSTLHEIYNLMNQDLSQIGEAWRDGKYEEFKESYSQEVKKCDDIATAYEEWCKDAIDPLMEKTEDINTAHVTPNGGGSSVKGGSAATGAGAAGAAGKAGGFNMGEAIGKAERSDGAKKIVKAIKNKPLTNADKECMQINPKLRAREIRAGETYDIEYKQEGTVNSGTEQFKVDSGVGLNGLLHAGLENTRTAPTTSATSSRTVRVKCAKPED